MKQDNRKGHNQIEINDLIDESVNNALARRNQVTDLSNEEAENIVGGLSTPTAIKICPPIIVGIIATDPIALKA